MTDTLNKDELILEDVYVNYALDFYKSAAEEVLSFDHPKAYLRLQKLTSDESYKLITLTELNDDVESILEADQGDECICVSLIFTQDPEHFEEGVLVCKVFFIAQKMDEFSGFIEWFPNNPELLSL